MLVDVTDGWAIGLSSLTWLVVSLAVGAWANGWSSARLTHTGPLTTLRRWERDGAQWQRVLRVSLWKDRVPEAGGLFDSTRSKRHVRSRATADLLSLRHETVRAERVHWLILASTSVHLLWCRPALAVSMVVFGLVLNVPFIVIQRYNRGRLDRVIRRRETSTARERSRER